jgi:hypothetical protein
MQCEGKPARNFACAQVSPTKATRLRSIASVWMALILLASTVESKAQEAPVRPPAAAPATGSQQTIPQPASTLAITVLDENGVAVQFAQASITGASGVYKCETDYAGRCDISGFPPSIYELHVEKEGFFEAVEKGIDTGQTESVDVTLNHQRELVEHVNVVYSPPLIDPEKTTSSSALSGKDIIDLPYTVPRDLRYALPLLPGVLPDATAQIHVDGSDSPQTIYLLDGFTLNAPQSRDFLTRVNVDAVRSITLQNSRYPAEYGGGTGGVLDLTTGMGDDHFRFTGTDFVPELNSYKGIHVGGWTPRFLFTGPLRRGKAWFLIAPEGEYNEALITGLPSGQDAVTSWRYGQLAKAQVNLSPSNILTGTFLINGFFQDHAGLSIFSPQPTTVDLRQTNHLAAVKDQVFLPGGVLFEVGLAETSFYSREEPLGDATYVINPTATSGNYFETSVGRSRRIEGIANLTLPLAAAGRHEVRFGVNLERITYSQALARNPFDIVRSNGTLDRFVSFTGPSQSERDNFAAGAYGQDRWSIGSRLTLTPGVRADWDEIVRDVLISPRMAASYVLDREGETKLVAGAGLYYDTTDLNVLLLPLEGVRSDVFYDATGKTPLGPPVLTSFQYAPGTLQEPRVFNWSAGLERKLPGSIYADFEYLQKRGEDGFAYYNSCTAITNCLSGDFRLLNQQQTHYDAARVNLRRRFKANHFVFASYTHSRARSNAALSFSLENPLFGPQVAGPLPWDAPNRLLTWGFLPLVRGYDLAYILDTRSGYPFDLVNQNQQLVAPPGAGRLPAYFSLNLAAEKRFHLFHFEWALRAGFNNITGHNNPAAVDNNVDSPQFMTYQGSEGRVLTGQIRLLGRKQ